MTNDEIANAFERDFIGCMTSVGAKYAQAEDAVGGAPGIKSQVCALWQQAKQLHLIFEQIWQSGRMNLIPSSFVIRHSSFFLFVIRHWAFS
jgi:hypothetical protein